MKFAILSVIAVLIAGSQAKFNLGDLLKPKPKQNNNDINLSLDDATQIYLGYVDGLMGIDLKGQIDKCEGVVPKAKNTFDQAIDKIERTTDFWMPFNKKIQNVKDAFIMVVMITPNMAQDLINCQP
jgi:hypothetical protein